MATLCFGCMSAKNQSPICEFCGFDERKQNQPHQLPIGTTLQNQYLVGKVLGQGGFGITYIGWDQHLSIPVAIKEYYPGGVVQRNTRWSTEVMCANGEAPEVYAKYRERFLNEARTLAQLSGIPEIVQIKSFFPENSTAYIVMEYVEGITLKEHLKRLGRPMTEEEALTIMEPVLRGLQKVHDQGLIHRDISPDNIMLPGNGGSKLIDFGTVRYMDDSGKSKSTEAVLKSGFAPMEQYNTRGNLGTWTDVYAICATFHYLLTGKVPADVHDRLDEGEELTFLRNTPGISADLIAVLEHGMKIRFSDRIKTLADLYVRLYGKNTVSLGSAEVVQTPTKTLPPPKFKKRFLFAGLAAAAIAMGILLPKSQAAPEPVETIVTEPVPAETEPIATVPPETLSPEEILYQEAEKLEAEGEIGKAAIAFAKLGDYRDSRERSFALWDLLPNRNTISFWLYTDDTNSSMVLHGITEDGALIYDTYKSIPFNYTLAQNYTTGYSSLVSIHGIIGLRYDGTLAYPAKFSALGTWTDIVQLSASYNQEGNLLCCVGLKSDGTVVAFGNNSYGECNVQDWIDIIAVSTGGFHVLGLKSDGSVVATGYASDGRCDVQDLSNVTAIIADYVHSFALKSDGTVQMIGNQRPDRYAYVVKSTDVVALLDDEYGSQGAKGLRADGSIVDVPGYWNNIVKSWTGIVDTIGNGDTIVALQKDGTLLFASENISIYPAARNWPTLMVPYVPGVMQ